MTEERQFPDFCKICLRQCSWPPVTRNQLGCNGYDSTVHSTGVHSTQYSAAVPRSRSKHAAAASEARRDWCTGHNRSSVTLTITSWQLLPCPPLVSLPSFRALIGAKSRGDNVMECPQPAGYSSRNNASKGWTFSAGNKCDILAIFAIFHPCEARWWAQCGNIRLGPGLAVTSDHPRHIWCNVWCGTGAQTGDYQKTQDLLKCFPSSVGEKKGIKRLIKQSIVRILEPENSKRSR